MFESLLATLQEETDRAALAQLAGAGDRHAADTLRFAHHWRELALADELGVALRARGETVSSGLEWLSTLLSPKGLGYAERPKALIPFHLTARGARSAFEEHLAEAAGYLADAARVCRVHFTIAPEHRAAIDRHLSTVRAELESRSDVHFEVSFSYQERASDTVAVDLAGRPFRNADGSLVLRPGGHGALLRNLQAYAAAGGDIVFIKNIDNVVPERSRSFLARWQQILGGHLLQIQEELFAHLERLESAEIGREDLAAALAFAEGRLGYHPARSMRSLRPEEWRRSLQSRLDRPLRVCAVVRSEGQPGGGPFWVDDREGEDRPQIVESAEVDHDSESQSEIWSSSTHFNPVNLVCALRDRRQQPYDLSRYRDPEAVFVSTKSSGGRRLKALEHPGLWNGAMAHWNTVFVEAPAATFAPVKSILDLLRPEHRS